MSFTEETFANAYSSVLAGNGGAITSGATAFVVTSLADAPVASTTSSPTKGFRAIIDGDTPSANTEIIWVLSANPATGHILNCVRAAETYPGGCPVGFPVAHNDGVPIRAILTAESYSTFSTGSGGGGGGGLISPVTQPTLSLAPCDLAACNGNDLGLFTYANVGAGTSGIGDTLTANANGVLVVDGHTCTGGERILVPSVADLINYNGAILNPGPPQRFLDGGYNYEYGIYTVTNPGSVSTRWVMTRATDCDTAAVMGSFWTTTILAVLGTNGNNMSALSTPYMTNPATGFVFGTDSTDISLWYGVDSQINGAYSIASPGATAGGFQSIALGVESFVSAAGSQGVALASGSAVLANWGVALSNQSWVSADFGVCLPARTGAYSYGQLVKTASQTSPGGVSSEVTMGAVLSAGGTGTVGDWLLKIVDGLGAPVWLRSYLIHVDIAVRVSTTHDSGWFTLDGVLKGDGVSAYSWAGSAPTVTLKTGDTSMSGWAFSPAIDNGGVPGGPYFFRINATASDPSHSSQATATATFIETTA